MNILELMTLQPPPSNHSLRVCPHVDKARLKIPIWLRCDFGPIVCLIWRPYCYFFSILFTVSQLKLLLILMPLNGFWYLAQNFKLWSIDLWFSWVFLQQKLGTHGIDCFFSKFISTIWNSFCSIKIPTCVWHYTLVTKIKIFKGRTSDQTNNLII